MFEWWKNRRKKSEERRKPDEQAPPLDNPKPQMERPLEPVPPPDDPRPEMHHPEPPEPVSPKELLAEEAERKRQIHVGREMVKMCNARCGDVSKRRFYLDYGQQPANDQSMMIAPDAPRDVTFKFSPSGGFTDGQRTSIMAFLMSPEAGEFQFDERRGYRLIKHLQPGQDPMEFAERFYNELSDPKMSRGGRTGL